MSEERNSEVLKIKEQEGILSLTMNRKEQRNALNSDLKRAIVEALDQASSDLGIKAVTLTGSGDTAFCSGQDLKEGLNSPLETIERELYALYRSIYYFPKPLIAAVNGLAAGGGFVMAILADFRVAVNHSKFSMPEINVGLPCVNGATVLNRLVGEAITAELVLRGKAITANEAFTRGLVSEVVNPEELAQKTKQLADELAEKSPMAYSINKLWIRGLNEFNWEKTKEFFQHSMKDLTESGELYKYLAKFTSKK